MGCCPCLSSSPQKRLKSAQEHLRKAQIEKKQDSKVKHCNRAEKALSKITDEMKEALLSTNTAEDQTLCSGISRAYFDLSVLLKSLGQNSKAQGILGQAKYWQYAPDTNEHPASSTTSGQPCSGNNTQTTHGHTTHTSPENNTQPTHDHITHAPPENNTQQPRSNVALVPSGIFPQNVTWPIVGFDLPKLGERVSSTHQLAYCLGLLSKVSTPSASPSSTSSATQPEERPNESQHAWIHATTNDAGETRRLHRMAARVVNSFINDNLKDSSTVTEVANLAPILEKDHYRRLLNTFIDGIRNSTILDFGLLEGIPQLIQSAAPDYLLADDLDKILRVLNTYLQNTHQQSTQHLYQLALVVSRVLDAMADSDVKGLSREQLHAPLSAYLDGLKGCSDSYLMYQAAYAYQALQYVPNDETPLKTVFRRANAVVSDISGLVSAVNGVDLRGCLEGLMRLGKVLNDVYKYTKAGYEGVASQVKSGKGLKDILKDGPSFIKRRTWYPALRATDNLLRDGRLADFKRLVCEAPCRHDPEFQWGLCLRLGEIAANRLWGASTQKSAIDFLGEIYKNDTDWGDHASVKQCILTALYQLSNLSECVIKHHTNVLLKELEKNGDVGKKALYHACIQRSLSHPLKIRIPPTTYPSLIEQVQDIPDIEDALRKLKDQRLAEHGKGTYISPQAKANPQASDDEQFPLMENVKEFLTSDRQVLLLLGNSGAGKSTFNRELECDLWDSYEIGESRIPLHINLSAIDRPDQDLIAKYLRKNDFTEPQIQEMKHYRAFILICDGYDESQQSRNLYIDNKLNQQGQWRAKMVISCRSGYLGADRDHFQPTGQDNRAATNLFQEVVIAPLSEAQIQDYIKKYVSLNSPLWQAEDYLCAINKIPNLLELVKNPFLLTLSLEKLPEVVNIAEIQDLPGVRIKRLELYDWLVEKWLEHGKKRLMAHDMNQKARAAYDTLVNEGFKIHGIDFLERLAAAIYMEQDGHPEVDYSLPGDKRTWKKEFFGHGNKTSLLREASPLIRNGNRYRFFHRSLLEYFFARAVFDPRKNEHGSTQEPFHAHPLYRGSVVDKLSLLGFLAERVQQEPGFKEHLLAMIVRSKTDKEGSTAAANAITILVRAGIQFNGADLKGIRIPGADLSGGEFNRAQMQGADLRNVNLPNIWLRQADLSDAQMAGVQFGERPHLSEDSGVLVCAYSSDGKTCAIGLENGTISLYDTRTWKKTRTLPVHTSPRISMTFSPTPQQIAHSRTDTTEQLWDTEFDTPCWTLSDHTDTICTAVYSLSGQQIASGGTDNTVRLWDAQNGTLDHTLKGHIDHVTSVAYSSDGQRIVSGSLDKTVWLWDTQTGTRVHVLVKHTEGVRCVAYSPKDRQIASGSDDKTVRLWDTQTGALGHILRAHSDTVRSVVYSSDGRQIASGSDDKTVRLWDTQTGVLGHVLNGHTDHVTSVVYSSDGRQIISGSLDRTVRLWDTREYSPGPDISGHTDTIKSVVYSSDGQQIASGSLDKSVRLWDTQTGTPGHILRGHTDTVRSVAYMPGGWQIASASDDKTVRLWDTQTGTPFRVLKGHTEGVTSIAYSLDGLHIASGSDDKTVRLWDAQSGEHIQRLIRHTGRITSLAFSLCGKYIASGSDDMKVVLWNRKEKKYSGTLKGHKNSVTCVAYSPGNEDIATGSMDKTIRLWGKRRLSKPVVIETGFAVLSVMYSPNGEQIASSGDDWKVVLWDMASRSRYSVIDFHGPVNCIAWCKTPDGSYLATGCDETSIHVWKLMEPENRDVRLHWSPAHDKLIVLDTI